MKTKEYERTTITIPKNLYRQIKMRAALKNKSVSRFITDILQKATKTSPGISKPLPFGKYNLGSKKLLRRDIYELYLKRKISR